MIGLFLLLAFVVGTFCGATLAIVHATYTCAAREDWELPEIIEPAPENVPEWVAARRAAGWDL